MSVLAVRWVISLLFGAGIATYLYILVAQRRQWTNTVGHLLHLAMSAAMILMVWDVGMKLPRNGMIIFFLLAGAWFAGAAVQMSAATGDRLINGYYAAMMAAMAWMFAVMNARLPGQAGHAASPGSTASAMNMSESEMTTAHETAPDPVQWITVVNWIAALGFAVVALYWIYRYAVRRQPNSVPRTGALTHLEPVYQACAAAGTALMLGALL